MPRWNLHGLTERPFKQWFCNYKMSVETNKNSTALSKYVWNVKEKIEKEKIGLFAF